MILGAKGGSSEPPELPLDPPLSRTTCFLLLCTTGVGKGCQQQHMSKLHFDVDERRTRGICSIEL